MSRTDERRAALRFCLVVLGWLGCLFGWASILSFNVADAPATTVWPNPERPHNLCGPVGAWVAYQAFKYLGVGAYPLLLLLHAAVVAASKGVRLNDLWLRAIGLLLICTVCAAGGALLLQSSDNYPITGPGGVLGTGAADFLRANLRTLGTALLLGLSLVVGLVLAADNLLLGLFRWLRWARERPIAVLARSGNTVAGARAAVDPVPQHAPRVLRQLEFGPDERGAQEPTAEARIEPAEQTGEATASAPTAQKSLVVKQIGRKLTAPAQAARPAPRPAAPDHYELPPPALLARPAPMDRAAVEALCREKAYVLEQTLNEFHLEVQVVAIETGPVITVFELKLAPGIKVSQIASLSNDMARALKAPAVRVVAPLAGKSTIGIEVPNVDKEWVRLRDVMHLAGSRYEKLGIPLFLGKDAAGQPLLADLTHMPHLLIAGTTGSGKSVCITSIIMSILMTRSPTDVKLILIDPKVVELAMYKDVPHLTCPIVTELSRAEAILEWASTKMDERYAVLAEAGVKDIRAYNRLGYTELRQRLQPASDEEMEQVPVRLPYVVIMVDELADLMIASAKEVEFYLCRIAQKSRAVGIHLIVSTQRPQATVVTGLIKSNMPCRIAFRVASRLDSRIVLDQNGGEVLMGQGDMLFLPPGTSKLVRAQGTFVEEDELRRVVQHCKDRYPQQFNAELVRMPDKDSGPATERDELFDEAVDVIIQTNRGSVSLLQRRFNIGYGRASRLVDQMYEAGIVGEYKGSQAREVTVTKEEWEAIRRQRDREEAEQEAELQTD